MNNSISRYQPQSGVTRLPDLMNRLFNESFVIPSIFDRSVGGGTTYPTLPVSLYETGEFYTMRAALPGLNAENLEISVTGREVSIKGQFQSWVPENGTPIWQGLPTGQFFETYTLPVDLDSDKVEATYTDGILTLTLPKAEHLRPRSIKVQVNK